MSYTVQDVNRIFSSSRHLVVHCRYYSSAGLHELDNALSRIRRELGNDLERDDPSARLIRMGRRYLHQAVAFGLRPGSPHLMANERFELLRGHGVAAQAHHPDSAGTVETILTSLAELRADVATPAEDEVAALLTEVPDSVIVLSEGRAGPMRALRESLAARGFGDTPIVVAAGGCRLPLADQLVTLGPLAWFPPKLVAAPRAPRISVVCPDWLDVGMPQLPSLYEINGLPMPRLFGHRPAPERAQQILSTLQEEEMEALLDRYGRHEGGNGEVEIVDAWVFGLAGGAEILLDVGYEPRVLLIEHLHQSPRAAEAGHDGDEEDRVLAQGNLNLRLTRIASQDLQPGMFLLERSRADSEILDQIVARLLGKRETALRRDLRVWKDRLDTAIKRDGLRNVANTLLAKGCRCAATPQNVRNWAGDDVILPASRRDFDVLLDYLGLLEQADYHWRRGKFLHALARRAGQTITELLFERLQEDLAANELLETGKAEISLPDSPETRFLIYRVETRSPKTIKVPDTEVRGVREPGAGTDVEE